MIDYGVYLNCTIFDFFQLLCQNSEKNLHHVFSARLDNGAVKKEKLSRQELEKRFKIDTQAKKTVLAAAHCTNNQLFHNVAPAQYLDKLSSLLSNDYLSGPLRENLVKFFLCVLKEKISNDEFLQIGELARGIEVDINNGNNITVKNIMQILRVCENDIISYLEKNFFPDNWKEIDPKLWDLYL